MSQYGEDKATMIRMKKYYQQRCPKCGAPMGEEIKMNDC
jgi:hypothetical protein